MSKKSRKKKKLAKKRKKAMRRHLQSQEANPQTPKQVAPKRKVSVKRKIRRKLSKMPLKVFALIAIVAFSLIFWAVSSKNEEALAHETQEVAQTTTAQTGEVVIQRSTYTIAGQPVAVRVSGDPNPDNNGLFNLHTDHQGSIVAVSDEDGNPVGDISRFYPYGAPRSNSSSEVTDRGYTGHKHNDDLGLIYMNSRYYVPGIGRFASADPFVPEPGNPQAFNRYSYVINNPINYVDPSGHCWGFASGIRNYGWGASACDSIDNAVNVAVNKTTEWWAYHNPCGMSSSSSCIFPPVSPPTPEEAVMEALNTAGLNLSPEEGRIIRDVGSITSKIGSFWRSRGNEGWQSTWEAFAPTGNVIAYEQDDKVVGALYFSSTMPQDPGLSQSGLYIVALEVLNEYSNQGIGTSLLREAALESVDQGFGGNLWARVNTGTQANWADILAFANAVGAQVIEDGDSHIIFFPSETLLDP